MKKIRYGLIGAGQMAAGHLGCIKAIGDMVELVAVAENYPKNLESFKSANDNPKTKYFTDYRELLELDEVDAVIIATPDNTHVDIVLDTVAAEKHVLSEKPAATSFKDLERLEKAVKKSKKIYQVGLECRYLPVFQRMKSIISNGTVGSPRLLWCKEFRGPFAQKVNNWIMFKDKSGGTFVEKPCHYFDLMTWFADSVPKKVIALAGQDVVKDIYGVKPDVYDNGWVTIEYKNGARANLGLCMFCECEYDIEMGVIGEKAVMEGFFQKRKIDIREYKTNSRVTHDIKYEDRIEKLSHGGGVYFEHIAFVENIRKNKRPLTNIEVAKWSTLVGLAAEESAANGGKAVTF